jgi:hypothetical protein
VNPFDTPVAVYAMPGRLLLPMRRITVAQVRAYLSAHKWTEAGDDAPHLDAYDSPDGHANIVLPHPGRSHIKVDVASVLANAIGAMAQYEGRTPAAVLMEIAGCSRPTVPCRSALPPPGDLGAVVHGGDAKEAVCGHRRPAKHTALDGEVTCADCLHVIDYALSLEAEVARDRPDMSERDRMIFCAFAVKHIAQPALRARLRWSGAGAMSCE